MTAYRPASSVRAVAERLIPRYHAHLDGVRIEYVFRDKHANSAGKEVWGKARKVSGLNAYLAAEVHGELAGGYEDFFVIEIAEDIWSMLEPKQREALVDHELCHITIEYDDEKDEVKLALRSHDVEEFGAVIQRHGLWRPCLEEFVATAAQGELDLFDDPNVTVELNGEPVTNTADLLKHGAGLLAAVPDRPIS
jgi:hypothetical protein